MSMAMDIDHAFELLENGKGGPEIIMEINERSFSYQEVALVEPESISRKTYLQPILTNYSIEETKHNDNVVDLSQIKYQTNGMKFNISRVRETSLEDKLDRSNRHRKNEFKSLARCNIDELDSLVTLTIGGRDYKELIQNMMKQHPTLCDQFSGKELAKLEGIKDISKFDDSNVDRLNRTSRQLRINVRDILGNVTGKYTLIAEKLAYLKQRKTQWEFNREVNREVCRQLNCLIYNGNPIDLDDFNNQYELFVEKIKRHLAKKNKPGFKYISVIEIQGNGNPHFHILCNLPYIDQWELQSKWGNGIVDIRKVKDIKDEFGIKSSDDYSHKKNKLIQYLYDQFDETSRDERMRGRQLFRSSKGLKRPIKIVTPAEIMIINNYLRDKTPDWNNDGHLIEGGNEYSRPYYIEKYNLDSNELYNIINENARQLVYQMIDEARRRGQKEITQDIFEQVITGTYLEQDLVA